MRRSRRRSSLPKLPLPHERDESPELSRKASPVIAQAARDLDAGRVDTDDYSRAAQASGFGESARKARR